MITNQQLVINNLEEKLKQFTTAVNGECITFDDFTLSNTKISTDTFNILVSKSPNIRNRVEFTQGINSLLLKGFKFSTWIDSQFLNKDWGKITKEYKLNEVEVNVMMKLENTLNVGQRNSQQLMINLVKNNEELMKYKEVFISLFEGTPEKDALESYFNKFSQMQIGLGVQMFVGYLNENMPVTTGLLIESKDSYGIYDVMTKEAFRGKGYGSEMFQFLLNQTKDKEKPVVLQASEDGINIYKRFGFIDVGEMVVFE
jgi:GNAT superfamily N-acetyltransferase